MGSHSPGGQWSSATSAAYGCTCHAQRSRSPMFPTSFTAISAGTCGGQDTKKTLRYERGERDLEHGPCFCCPHSCFLWCLQPKQPELSPGWQPYCHFVWFLLTITTILIYPSFFLLLATMRNWTEGTFDNGEPFICHEQIPLLIGFIVVCCAVGKRTRFPTWFKIL